MADAGSKKGPGASLVLGTWATAQYAGEGSEKTQILYRVKYLSNRVIWGIGRVNEKKHEDEELGLNAKNGSVV